MKFLLEFAKFRDLIKTDNEDFKKYLNNTFKIDEELLDHIYNEYYNKKIKIVWYNNKTHSIIDRIKKRTTFISVSEFNEAVKCGLEQVFPDEIGKGIRGSGRYAIHFNINKFYLIISLNYNNLFNDDSEIYIVSLVPSVIEKDVIEVYEEN